MSNEERSTPHLLACGLAPAMFIVVIMVAGFLRPDYDWVHHWGSELGLGPLGWIQSTNFIVTGVATTAFAFGLRRISRPGRGSLFGPLFTGLFGLSLIVAGVFVIDPQPGYAPLGTVAGQKTLHGMVHDLNVLPCFAVLTAAILVFSYRFAGERRRAALAYSLASATVVLATFVASGILFTDALDHGTLPESLHGLVQRITIATGFGWFSVLAVYYLRRSVRSAPAAEEITANAGRTTVPR
jgi:hypothetical protein